MTPYHIDTKEGTGFSFGGRDAYSMRQVYDFALQTYYDRPEDWYAMVHQAMKRDFSWTSSAEKYIWLYREISG